MIVVEDIVPDVEANTGDGWILEDMNWDADTGVSRFEYSRKGHSKIWIIFRDQPTHPGHQGWSNRAPERVYELVPS